MASGSCENRGRNQGKIGAWNRLSTVHLVDADSGGVAERYLYDPYGKVTVLNGASGAEKDLNVAGLVLCRARHLSGSVPSEITRPLGLK